MQVSTLYKNAKHLRSIGSSFKSIALFLYGESKIPFDGITVKHWLACENTAERPDPVIMAQPETSDVDNSTEPA